MTLNDSVEHKTINDIDIEIYTYTDNGHIISIDDYFALLEMFLNREGVIFNHLIYEYDDEFDHIHRGTIKDVREINNARYYGSYDFDAYFEDKSKNYKLAYSTIENRSVKLYSSYKNQDEKKEGQHKKS